MKKSYFASTALLACLFLGTSGVAQTLDVDKMPTITTTGTAEVRVVPNEAIFTLEVEKIDKDLQIAQKQNDDTVSQIINLAKTFGIQPQNVKTDFYEYEQRFTYTGKNEDKRVFLGYAVSKTVIVRLSDMSKFEDFFREIIKAGVSKVEDVDLQTTDIRKHKDEARAMAIKAAREKAMALTREIGQSIGKAVRISEGVFSAQPFGAGLSVNSNATSNNFSTSGESYSASLSANENATFSPGTISVKAEVTVSFLLN